MTNGWIQGGAAFLHKNKAPVYLDIYTPIALLNVICEISGCVFGNRPTPVLNPLTGDSQSARNPIRSSIDGLPTRDNEVKTDPRNPTNPNWHRECIRYHRKKNNAGRPIRKRGPCRYIRALQQRHNGAKLRPKIDGQLGNAIGSNKVVSHGAPLSAKLYAIGLDASINGYDNALPGEIKQTPHDTYERGEFEDRKMANRLWRNRI